MLFAFLDDLICGSNADPILLPRRWTWWLRSFENEATCYVTQRMTSRQLDGLLRRGISSVGTGDLFLVPLLQDYLTGKTMILWVSREFPDAVRTALYVWIRVLEFFDFICFLGVSC